VPPGAVFLPVLETLLRPATPADEPFLERLYASTRERELEAVPWPPEFKQDFLRMQSRAQRADYRRRFPEAEDRIILVGEEPAGRFYVDRNESVIRLVDISLLPEHRGRGIGGRLLGELLAEADSTGKPVRLMVERGNPARRLYLRLGFRVLNEDEIYCSMEWSSAHVDPT
jgi:ribosomal protein S18 acetylase RimI-like enzyme